MPRNYVRKKPAPSYTKEDLARAVNDVKNKNLTYRQAEQQYRVPISVIYTRIKGRKVSIEKMGGGRSPILSHEVEQQIVLCLIARAQIGYPCDKQELKSLVADYLKSNIIVNTPFKNDVPGEDWYQSFMKRNPNISLKKPEHLQRVRKTARNPEVVYDFYSKLQTLYDENDLNSTEKASFIFNCDESGFASDPSRLRAIGEKGKPLSRVSGGSGRESTTVLLCVAADGHFLPPLIVFKGAAVQARWTSNESYPGTEYAASKNGWMEEPQFFNWFKNCFVGHVNIVRANHGLPEQTAVLIYDGHSSHISIRIIEEAMNNKIQLVRLPSHLTDRIQPLDKCVFGPVKIKWDKKLVDYGKTQMGIGTGRLSKDKFGILLGQVLRESVKPQNIINGFVTTGLFPIDHKKFPEDLFDPTDLQRYKLRQNHRAALSLQTITQDNLVETDPPVRKALNIESNSLENHIDLAKPGPSSQKSLLCASTLPQTSADKNELELVAIDLSTRISEPSPQKIQTPKSIVEIFSNIIKKNQPLSAEKCIKSDMQGKKVPIPRLKQSNYGEVLTATEVLERLKVAQEKKDSKKTKTKKRGKNIEKSVTIKKKKMKETVLCIKEDSTDSENEESFRTEMEIKNTAEVTYKHPEKDLLTPGSYVLVDFLGGNRKKTHYSYVCVINSFLENCDYLVTGMKSTNPIKTDFIVVKSDTSTINYTMIKALLPAPKVECKDRKLVYVFPGAVAVNEK